MCVWTLSLLLKDITPKVGRGRRPKTDYLDTLSRDRVGVWAGRPSLKWRTVPL